MGSNGKKATGDHTDGKIPSGEHLWSVVASGASPEWLEARRALEAAETRLKEIEEPENAPLGLIGDALQSGEINATREGLYAALADFTRIDEVLRQREDLRQALDLLARDHLTAETSLQVSIVTKSVSAELDRTLNAEEPREQSISLRDSFSAYAKRILGRVTRKPTPSAPSS